MRNAGGECAESGGSYSLASKGSTAGRWKRIEGAIRFDGSKAVTEGVKKNVAIRILQLQLRKYVRARARKAQEERVLG